MGVPLAWVTISLFDSIDIGVVYLQTAWILSGVIYATKCVSYFTLSVYGYLYIVGDKGADAEHGLIPESDCSEKQLPDHLP